MQPADDVKFRRALGDGFRGARENLIERKCVCARHVRRAPERAQLAMRDADIRRIDVPVDVEVADVAVALLADVVREPADCEQIVRLEEREAVFGAQALAGENLVRDWLKTRVRDLQLAAHFSLKRDSSGQPRALGMTTKFKAA